MVSFYAQREYISENLCINRFDAIPICKGQCYLTKQLKENEKREQKLPELKQKEIQLFFQSNTSIKFDKAIIKDQKNFTLYVEKFFSSEFLYSVFHPPKIA
jgi:actin-related protein